MTTYRRKCDLTPEEIDQIETEINYHCHQVVADWHNVKRSTIKGIAHARNKRHPFAWYMHKDAGKLLERVLTIVDEASDKAK